jgi:methylated-DNA-[protein]-cysteine S-methyltransferase
MSQIVMQTPVGALKIEERDGAITAIDWTEAEARAPEDAPPVLIEAKRQLDSYFAGKLREFDLPLSARAFRSQVWLALQDIPYGETRTYGELAQLIGSAPRAVGGACGANPIAIVIPCHRVIGAGGWLGGYSGGQGIDTKTHLLEHERDAAP